MSMWGGRFQVEGTDSFKRINDSLRFDWRLVEADIHASRAWADAIVIAGAIGPEERDRIHAALDTILQEVSMLDSVPLESGAEDVHSWIESRLIALEGDLGKKLHTGRSRNDQVATDLKLWTRDTITNLVNEIRATQKAILDLAEREIDTILPAYTHLQRAVPIPLAHWALGHAEALVRDIDRFECATARLNECPLGSAAMAGSTWPIDRDALAVALGFDRPTRNSMDAVADRDFVVDTVSACASCAGHLSRLAEDLILYTSEEFSFARLGDEVTSGSSLLPHKKNPDALELARGKVGRILGAHVALITMLKGLPSAYNKDMQEDKEPLFDATDALSDSLLAVRISVESIRFNSDATRRAAEEDHSAALALADALVSRGVPFRDAHDAAGVAVRRAIEAGVPLHNLPEAKLMELAPGLEPGDLVVLSVDARVARPDVIGGCAPSRVRAALTAARTRLDEDASMSQTREHASIGGVT